MNDTAYIVQPQAHYYSYVEGIVFRGGYSGNIISPFIPALHGVNHTWSDGASMILKVRVGNHKAAFNLMTTLNHSYINFTAAYYNEYKQLHALLNRVAILSKSVEVNEYSGLWVLNQERIGDHVPSGDPILKNEIFNNNVSILSNTGQQYQESSFGHLSEQPMYFGADSWSYGDDDKVALECMAAGGMLTEEDRQNLQDIIATYLS